MGLKIGERMHLVGIDENNYKHNIFIYVWGIHSMGHKFDVFAILPKYHLYS
jgi:hypothetical protein